MATVRSLKLTTPAMVPSSAVRLAAFSPSHPAAIFASAPSSANPMRDQTSFAKIAKKPERLSNAADPGDELRELIDQLTRADDQRTTQEDQFCG